MFEIVDGLWIGNLRSLSSIAKTNKENKEVSGRSDGNDKSNDWTIVSLVNGERFVAFVDATTKLAGLPDEALFVWQLPDKSGADFLSENLLTCLDKIDDSIQAGRPCLVHCALGISRSAAVCTAWLISRRNMTLQDALGLVRTAKPDVLPNMGFLASLRAIEQCNGNIEAARKRLEPAK